MKNNTRIGNQEGSVIVLALILLVLLTLLGISATRTSTIEVQIAANERQAVQNLYQAESGNYYALEISDSWMSSDFLSAAETAAYVDSSVDSSLSVDIDGDDTDDVTIEIRCIEDTGTPVDILSDEANNLPTQQHISPPPVGSGYSLNDYEIRRYGITATSTNGSSPVQVGVYKVFNKY
jgi:Tfp pilus assembly protein PilX